MLDTENTEWLENRLASRINQMIFDEGGLVETVDLFGSILRKHFEAGKLSSDQLTPNGMIDHLSGNSQYGVLQAIGYKEFLPIIELAFSRASKSLAEDGA